MLVVEATVAKCLFTPFRNPVGTIKHTQKKKNLQMTPKMHPEELLEIPSLSKQTLFCPH